MDPKIYGVDVED